MYNIGKLWMHRWVCASTFCALEGNSFTTPEPFRDIKVDVWPC